MEPKIRCAAWRKRLAVASLWVFIVFLSLFCLDVLFRFYEGQVLIKTSSSFPNDPLDLRILGYNETEEPLTIRARPEDYRILSIGDSFAFAITRPAYTYAGVLQQELKQDLPGRTVRVLNVGVPGISFPGYVNQYRFWAANADFDGVIFNLYTGNDFMDDEIVALERSTLDKIAVEAKQGKVRYGIGTCIPSKYQLRFLDYFYSFYHSIKSLRKIDDKRYSTVLEFPYDRYVQIMVRSALAFTADAWPKLLGSVAWLERFLETVKEAADAGKQTLLVISPPHFLYSEQLIREIAVHSLFKNKVIDPYLPSAVIIELARRIGYVGPILDLTACLADAGPGDILYYTTNTHWSVEGNAVVGHLLALTLRSVWLHLATCLPLCLVEDTRHHTVTSAAILVDTLLSTIHGFPAAVQPSDRQNYPLP